MNLRRAPEGGAAPQVTFRVTQFADNLRNEVRRDIPEGCVKAYENGVYTKALEYVDFHERLRASHSSAAAMVAKVRATLREMSCGGGADVGAVPAGVPGPVMGALDSAATACQSLIAMWQTARYNEDLATNPAWAPPTHGSNALAVPDWWRARDGSDLNPGCAVPVAVREGLGQLQRRLLRRHLRTRHGPVL